MAVGFGIVLVAMSAIALGAPLISDHVTHQLPEQQDLRNVFAPPSAQHWLGADELGRDTFTRLVWGAQVSLSVGFLSVALYIILGGGAALVAGYYGGYIDEAIMRLVDVLLSTPTIYLLILIGSLLPMTFGPVVIKHDAISMSVIIALTSWGGVARLVRSEVLSLKHTDYVVAARAIGARDGRIMLRHIFPNVLAVIVVAASLGVGQVILVEAALDYIGVGVRLPIPTWGNMLLNAQTYFSYSTLLVVLPGAAIVLAVLAANVVGNAVRDALDPKLAGL
jgi:ABC-type dipeptide/oligopeptide/nickel transport system permease subunit